MSGFGDLAPAAKFPGGPQVFPVDLEGRVGGSFLPPTGENQRLVVEPTEASFCPVLGSWCLARLLFMHPGPPGNVEIPAPENFPVARSISCSLQSH